MKFIYFFSIFFATVLLNKANAQNFKPTDDQSSVKFVIKNFGINVDGSFKNLRGTINFDSTHLATSNFNVTVDANTINTTSNARDNHLRKEEYFNVAAFPTISFASDKIEKAQNPSSYIVTGRFIIKGKSKSVTIPFTAVPQTNGYLFNGKVVLNRRDFGVGGSSFILSDKLTLSLQVLAKK